MRRTLKNYVPLLLAPLVVTCLGYPEGVKPVTEFELEPYLGKWYEIARLDHKFERGMSDVTAEYTLRNDGGVAVRNRGFLVDDGEWREALGKAFFVEDENVGYLKVSFFGPFYGSYVIFDLDPNEYAFISGANTSYLWLLSRTPTVSKQLKETFKQRADALGFDSGKLIWVKHSRRND